MKRNVGALYKNIGRVRIWGVIAPRVHIPKNVAFGYDVGKISAVCLVVFTNLLIVSCVVCDVRWC